MVPALKRRALRCSFCGRTDAQMARLIAGPKVHICDACVGTCNRILKATPPSLPESSGAGSDAQLLASLRPCLAALEATREVLQTQVDALRDRGVSWAATAPTPGARAARPRDAPRSSARSRPGRPAPRT